MRIKKTYRSAVQQGKVLNERSTSQDNTYSCDYLNGTVLFSSTSGEKANVTLNDSLANYTFIDIEFKNSDGSIYYTNRYYSPNGKTITMFYQNIVANTRYLFEKRYSCNGTAINKVSCYQYNGSSNSYGTYDSFAIMTVIGYK